MFTYNAHQVACVVGHAVDHPRGKDQAHDEDGNELRDKGQRLLLNAGRGLDNTNHEANDERNQQRWCAEFHGEPDCIAQQADNVDFRHGLM